MSLSQAQFETFLERQSGNRRKNDPFSSGLAKDWKAWKANMQAVAAAGAWTDKRKRAELKAGFTGEAWHMVADILAAVNPETVADNTPAKVAELWAALEARFVPAAAGPAARAEFRTSRQATQETVLQWHSRLRHLFSSAYPTLDVTDSQSAVDQFVCGLLDENVKMYVLENDPQTYADALTTAGRKEAAEKQLQLTRGGAGRRSGAGPALNAMDGPGGATDKECWFCKQPGHLREACAEFNRMKEYFVKYLSNQGRRGGGGSGGRGRGGRGRGGRGRGRGGPAPAAGAAPAPPARALNAMGEDEEDLTSLLDSVLGGNQGN